MTTRIALAGFALALLLSDTTSAQTLLIGGRAFDGSIEPSVSNSAQLASSCGVLSQCSVSNPTPGGLTWDGTYIWQANYFGAAVLEKIDPVTCAVVSTIPAPASDVGGLAWDGSALWACVEQQGLIYRVDPTNGNVLSSIPAPAFGSSDPNSSDVAWDGQNLWHVDYLPAGLFKLDPANGNILANLPPPGPGPSGVSFAAGVLVVSDYQSDLIYRVDPTNGNVLSSCPAPDSHPWGVEVTAGGSTWNSGASSHQLFEIDTALSSISIYCTAGTSSTGCIPAIGYAGTPSIAASSGFTLSAVNVNGQKSGLFFYGLSGRNASPWGAGSVSILCVKPPVQRMSALNSGGTLGACDGSLAQDWLAFVATTPTALGQPFAAGNVVNAQGWYRDPLAPKTTNLTDALEFTVLP